MFSRHLLRLILSAQVNGAVCVNLGRVAGSAYQIQRAARHRPIGALRCFHHPGGIPLALTAINTWTAMKGCESRNAPTWSIDCQTVAPVNLNRTWRHRPLDSSYLPMYAFFLYQFFVVSLVRLYRALIHGASLWIHGI